MAISDIDAVMDLEVRAYSHPWSRGNFIDSLAAGHVAEVCVQADRLVGYFVALPGVDELHLLNLTVAAAHQNRGQGSALLNAVLGHARARQLATVWLEVRASNGHARRLYARRGFEEVGLRRGYYPAHQGREDAVVMRLVMSAVTSAVTSAVMDAVTHPSHRPGAEPAAGAHATAAEGGPQRAEDR
jgi:ribosomal-protein-alanine N-acetyltransferase